MAQLPLSTALEQAERSDGTAMAKFPLSTAVEQAERSDGAAADQREVATPTQQETAGRGRSNGMRIKAGEHGRLRGSTRYLAGSRAEPNAEPRPFQRPRRKKGRGAFRHPAPKRTKGGILKPGSEFEVTSLIASAVLSRGVASAKEVSPGFEVLAQ